MDTDEVDPILSSLIGPIFTAVADYGSLSPEHQDAILAADDKITVDCAIAAFHRRVAQGRRASELRAGSFGKHAVIVVAEDLAEALWSPAATLDLAARLLARGPLRVAGPELGATASALASLLGQAGDGDGTSSPTVDPTPALPVPGEPATLADLVAPVHGAAPHHVVVAAHCDDQPTTILVLPDTTCLTIWSRSELAALRVGLDLGDGSPVSGRDHAQFRLAIATTVPAP